MNNYNLDLPSIEYIREGLQYTYEYWQPRNNFIRDVRAMLTGQNSIAAPKDTPYKIKTIHTYGLAAIVNEKAARFTHLPTIQVVPNDEQDSSREKSSQLEIAINMSMSEMERRSDGDVWARAVLDALTIDEGVERIERAPAAFWPEVVTIVNGKPSMPMEDTFDGVAIKKLKQQYGLPIRSVYVPLENFYPVYEGPTLVESYEIEQRSLRDVLRNPLFDTSELQFHNKSDSREGLRTQVNIVHYVNHQYHVYYALTPANTFQTPNNTTSTWPNLTSIGLENVGQPVLLYAYEQGLGRSLYNCIAGRFGGWKSTNNRIEGVGKALLEINQASDELLSQVLTNKRATYWPSLLQKVDPDQRGIEVSGTPPKAPVIQEGQNHTIYKDETIEPLFKPVDDPMVTWLFDTLQTQIGRLGGSPVIFGQSQPGVNTGYHQALQITQSEHLDEKIEQHLSIGAINRASIMLQHIKTMDLGEVYVHATEMDSKNRKTGKYYTINPADLFPLPQLDAQVRKPRPVDFASSVRAAREASDERQGKGPLLSDDSIRADLLAIEAPDVEQHKINVEREKRKMLESGLITQKIMEALNLKLAVNGPVQDGQPTNGATPPMLDEAIKRLQTGSNETSQPQQTSVPPSGSPLPPGMPIGQSQPEAISGNEISNAVFGGR